MNGDKSWIFQVRIQRPIDSEKLTFALFDYLFTYLFM